MLFLIASQTINSSPASKESPKLSDLMNDVAASAPDQWAHIGTMLEVDQPYLNNLKKEQYTSLTCFRNVFTRWQYSESRPYCWDTIVEVLESEVVQRHDIASKIRDKYLK